MKIKTARNFAHTVDILINLAFYNPCRARAIALDIFSRCKKEGYKRTVDEILVEEVNKRRKELGLEEF